MFNPNNLDEVYVQATHIESKGNTIVDKFSTNPFKPCGNMYKGRGKGQKATIVKKGGDKPTCMHCKKKGHDTSK